MINCVIFSGLIYIVLPGFKGEKPLKCCLTGNFNVKDNKTSILQQNS